MENSIYCLQLFTLSHVHFSFNSLLPVPLFFNLLWIIKTGVQVISAYCSCWAALATGAERGVRCDGWPGIFTKQQASEAKMQCSPKVTATHRVSCDIFITEVEKKKKNKTPTRPIPLISLCTCTTFRSTAVIPAENGSERKEMQEERGLL